LLAHFQRSGGLVDDIETAGFAVGREEAMIVLRGIDGLGEDRPRWTTARPPDRLPEPQSSNQFSGDSTA